MVGRWEPGVDCGPGGGSRSDLEPAADLVRAVGHAAEPDAGHPVLGKTSAVVGHVHGDPVVVPDTDLDVLGVSVAYGVRDRLHHDPERGHLDRRGHRAITRKIYTTSMD